MNKTCARCSKVVYNIEELKCLDKTWHKTCFRCHECGMMLNMKTYKGFNKLPYCEAHIPKAKATAIADTPELKRIAENTKIQSNVKYHAEFEKQKGKLTQVADDPETLRIKANTKIISNVAYHGDLEKKAAMEKQRGTAEVVETRDNESEYFSETLAAEQLTQYQQSQHQQQHHHQPPTTQTHIHQAIMQNTQPSIASQQPQIIAQNNSQSYSGMAHQQQQQQQNNQLQHQQMQSYPKQPPPQQQQQSQLQQQSQQQMKHSPPTSQNYQQNVSNQSNYPSQNYQQIPQNNYMHIRSSIVQNAHLPSGGQVAQDMSKYYDQYENYARPTSNAQIPQNSYNNNNNPSVYNQQQQLQQQNFAYQQQQQQQQQQMQGNGGGQTQAGVGYNSQYNQMNYNSSNVPGMNSVTTVIGNGSSNGSVLGGVGVIGGSSGIGKIADYDPLTDGPRNMPSTTRQSATLIYSSDRGAVTSSNNPRRVGSIADIDPANGIYGSITEQNNAQNQYYQQQNQARQGHHHHHQQQQKQQPPPQQVSQQQQQNHQTKTNLRLFRALYDYEAQDTDEVSFSEGDLIFEVESIDSGWMTGKVERTGKTGMLPANYVQPAVI